ncbi:hypothetical protein [uncultured Mycobacterium sp.]|uniref:hypothetical protein n=1 Tax=uncultured Mycobacterium sp. TaxID=171292 RepID=UPI0035CB987A
MCPSAEADDAQAKFAADVLRDLLGYIAEGNDEGERPYWVTHAWTEGPLMYLVYKAPPDESLWGLVRDTRESLIDPGPWQAMDNAAYYYYLLDLQEGWYSPTFPDPVEPDTIEWRGHPACAEAPKRPADIPKAYRYTPPANAASSVDRDRTRVVNEARRYADPRTVDWCQSHVEHPPGPDP